MKEVLQAVQPKSPKMGRLLGQQSGFWNPRGQKEIDRSSNGTDTAVPTRAAAMMAVIDFILDD